MKYTFYILFFQIFLIIGRYSFFSRFSFSSRFSLIFLIWVFLWFLYSLQSFFFSIDFTDFYLLGLHDLFLVGKNLSRFGQNSFIRKQGFELASISYNTYQTRFIRHIHTLVRVGPKGVPSQLTDKAKGHYACVDLTVDEIDALTRGETIIKDKVLIATSNEMVDGIPTLFVSKTNLENNSVEQFAVNDLVRCAIIYLGIKELRMLG